MAGIPVLNLFLQILKQHFGDNFPIAIEAVEGKTSHKFSVCAVDIPGEKFKDKIDQHGNIDKNKNIKVAIANMRIGIDDIERAVRRNRSPNTSQKRQSGLWEVLNSAVKNQVDILALPEVSIPVSWLPFMVSHSRRHQIALVFGLEHWVINNVAYNFLVEVLPFQINNKYNSCIVNLRVKNHYSPKEKALLNQYNIGIGEPAPNNWYYQISLWQGLNIASYNCYELADIEHRSLFRSELDLLIACVWNMDTNYYDHILESSVRDLYCYVMQANTAQYGGSCVLQPSSSITSQVIRVKGGENYCILTATLDITKLRDAQHKRNPSLGDDFKHTPPGFDHEKVLERS